MKNNKAINVNTSFNAIGISKFPNNIITPDATKINKNIINTDLHIFLFLPSIDLEIVVIQTPKIETNILI